MMQSSLPVPKTCAESKSRTNSDNLSFGPITQTIDVLTHIECACSKAWLYAVSSMIHVNDGTSFGATAAVVICIARIVSARPSCRLHPTSQCPPVSTWSSERRREDDV
jgi:hypothetical protein